MKTNIFDERNSVVGWTLEDSHRIEIFDRRGRLLGYYVKASDSTHDAAFRFIGKDNQLLRLLK